MFRKNALLAVSTEIQRFKRVNLVTTSKFLLCFCWHSVWDFTELYRDAVVAAFKMFLILRTKQAYIQQQSVLFGFSFRLLVAHIEIAFDFVKFDLALACLVEHETD